MKVSGVYDFFNKQWFEDCQDVFVFSDTHFGEDDLKQAFPNRPSDDELVKRINSVCGRTSCLVLLGDVGDLSYVQKLRAKRKILICGNHDKGAENYQRKQISRVFDADIFSKEQAMAAAKGEYPDYEVVNVSHKHDFFSPFEYWQIELDNKLFDEVITGPLMLGPKLMLSHEPLGCSFAYNIHGHNHTNRVKGFDQYWYNVCADVCDYKPVSLNGLIKKGVMSHFKDAHRLTIDRATERKKVRNNF